MKKELVIFIVIVIIILIGNYITENYTNHCVSQTSEYLYELKEDIEQEEIDNEIVKEKVENIYNDWIEKHKKLAYYTEHDELEKVETDLNVLRGNIYMEEYSEAVSEVYKITYILEHIKNKTNIKLVNIF